MHSFLSTVLCSDLKNLCLQRKGECVLEAISAIGNFSEVSDPFSLQLPPLHHPEHQGTKPRKPGDFA